ncbi:MAG: helix-turn-helix domain-containing protein [Myxococcota bacterium]
MAPEPRSDCPIACSLDVIGDRWTLVVLRDVLLAQRRTFGELAQAEGIAPNILSERLARLEAAGVLTKERDPADGRRRLYLPTERGLDLIPVLLAVGRWGILHTPGCAHADFFLDDGDPEAREAHLRERATAP